MTVIRDSAEPLQRGNIVELMAAFRCDHCNRISVAVTYSGVMVGVSPSEIVTRLKAPEARWYPAAVIGREFGDVPDHISQAASEAHQCADVGAYRAAIAMCRAVTEATAKDKGAKTGTLQQKIDKLRDDGLIRECVREAAHEIRHFGNDMAHGGFVDPVSQEEAAFVLTFMGELLQEVYQSPARVSKARALREAKKKSSPVVTTMSPDGNG
jgi:hypothetical protein